MVRSGWLAGVLAGVALWMFSGCAVDCEKDADCATKGPGYVCVNEGCALSTPSAQDGGAEDGGADAGRPDAGSADGGAFDAGADGGPGDGGAVDGGAADGGAHDAGSPDAGTADAGAPDAGTPDAGLTCTPTCSGSVPLCDSASGTCVECFGNGDCSGATPTCNVPTHTCVSSSVPTPTLYWSDEFSSAVSADRWGTITKPFSAGNIESQWYQANNVTVNAGTLKIVAKKETHTGSTSDAPEMSFVSSDGTNYATPMTGLPAGSRPFTSGMLSTRDAAPKRYFPLFGRFEIRARVPFGQGLLPAFWLRRIQGASWGEVDIMEYFGSYKPGYSKFSLHFPNTIGVNATQQTKFFEAAVPGSSGWHTWDVEIRPSHTNADPLQDPIVFTSFLDGAQAATYTLTDVQSIRDLHMIDRSTGQPIDPDHPNLSWDVCVNMAVGGKWVGQPDQQLGYLPIVNRCSLNQKAPPGNDGTQCSTTGLFFSELPATYEVDYVRVYDLGY